LSEAQENSETSQDQGTSRDVTQLSLEEKVKYFQEQGLLPEKIAEAILKEDLNTNVSELAKLLLMNAMDVGRVKGRLSKLEKRRKEAEMDTEAEALPTTPPITEAPINEGKGELETGGLPPLSKSQLTPTEYVAYYGVEGLDELKRQRLIELLNSAPSIGKRTIVWVNKQWQLDPSVRRDLNQLLNVLTGCGVKSDIAYRICNVLQSMDEEYGNLLRRGTQPMGFYGQRSSGVEGSYPPFPTRQQQPSWQESFPRQFPQQPYDYGYGYGWYPPRPEDFAKRVAEELRREREGQQGSQPQVQQVVTITEPLRDAEGKLVYDKDGNPVYRKVTGPMSQIGIVSQEDPTLKTIKILKEAKELSKPEHSELTEERVRNVIREEVSKTDEKITKEDIQKVAEESAARVLASKEHEDKEERRHRETLQAIREGAGQKTIEGYKTDEFRFMGQGMQQLATREPKAVKVVTEFLERVMGSSPSPKEVQPGAGEGVLGRLNQKYVAEE